MKCAVRRKSSKTEEAAGGEGSTASGGGAYGEFITGFFAAKSHRVVPIDKCPVLAPQLNGLLVSAWSQPPCSLQSRTRCRSLYPAAACSCHPDSGGGCLLHGLLHHSG